IASRPAGAGIHVEDFDLPHVHAALRRLEHEVGQLEIEQMVGRAVVLRHRQVRGQRKELLRHATPQTFIATRAYVSAVLTRPSISRFSPSSTFIRPASERTHSSTSRRATAISFVGGTRTSRKRSVW